jgi:hypothetical protein
MADPEDATEMAQPTPNPDAQATVNDFLDYTEFFPSDLVRSLTLIGDLDSTYRDAVQQVHDLTSLYGQLPTLPEQERTDPVLLRRRLSTSESMHIPRPRACMRSRCAIASGRR